MEPTRRYEVEEKQGLLEELMRQEGIDALFLRKVSSFAWATAGAPSYVNGAVDVGEATLLLHEGRRKVLTSVIEAARLGEEEGLAELGFEVVSVPWGKPVEPELRAAIRIGSDAPRPGERDVAGAVARLRGRLGPGEIERFRALARDSAQALNEAALRVEPGQTEVQIGSAVGEALLRRGLSPIVLQVGTDERLRAYRHVLPTQRRLERHAMLSFCARRNGLVCSLTRFLHFGPVPEELQRAQDAAAHVDAAMLDAARAGATLEQVFQAACEEYVRQGFPAEWLRHHQGGLAGYEPREVLARAGESARLERGHVVAFNPSVPGAKSEDTCLVTDALPEVITHTPEWPRIAVEVGGTRLERPGILRR